MDADFEGGFDSDPGLFGFPVVFAVVFAAVALFILTMFVLVGISAVRNARALRRAGVDPLAVESTVLLRLMRQQPGGRTMEQRLAELDDLHRRRVITDAEHASARARLITGTTSG